jgi:hypothetical protein
MLSKMKYSLLAGEDSRKDIDAGKEETIVAKQSDNPDVATRDFLLLSPINASVRWSSPPPPESVEYPTSTIGVCDDAHQCAQSQEELEDSSSHGTQPDSPLLAFRNQLNAQIDGSDAPLASIGIPPARQDFSDYASQEIVELDATRDLIPENTAPSTWMPYTVRWWYMCLIIFFTSALTATVVGLLVKSHHNDGLTTDDDTSSLLFGWRFSPTLLAVCYAQAIAMLYEDVRRTEPFALLARPQGSRASSTLLQGSDAWWTVLRKSSTMTDGKRNWALFCACMVNVLAFLVIAPLSSSVLTSVDFAMSRDTEFSSLVPRTDTVINLDTGGDTFFRTISNLLQNVTTSAFITGPYVIFPTWPSTMTDIPLGSRLSRDPHTWLTRSLIYQLEYDCVSAEATGIPDKPTIEQIKDFTEIIVPRRLEKLSSCSYVVDTLMAGDARQSFLQRGGAVWTSAKLSNSSTDERALSCNQDVDAILLFSSWKYNREQKLWRPSSNTTAVKAQICTTKVYQADVAVTITNLASRTRVDFNETSFKEQRAEILPTVLDVPKLRRVLIDPRWSDHLSEPLRNAGQPLETGGFPMYDGASAALGAFYEWNLGVMLQAEDIPARARQIQQRLFGELIQISTGRSNASEVRRHAGSVIRTERRILAVPQVAIAVASLLVLSLVILSLLFWISRLSIRPLGLVQDPATVVGLASQIRHVHPRPDLFELNCASRKDINLSVGNDLYRLDSTRRRNTIVGSVNTGE